MFLIIYYVSILLDCIWIFIHDLLKVWSSRGVCTEFDWPGADCGACNGIRWIHGHMHSFLLWFFDFSSLLGFSFANPSQYLFLWVHLKSYSRQHYIKLANLVSIDIQSKEFFRVLGCQALLLEFRVQIILFFLLLFIFSHHFRILSYISSTPQSLRLDCLKLLRLTLC